MTPEELQDGLLPGSAVAVMLQLPGGRQLYSLITENLRVGHVVAVSAEVRGSGVCYRLTPFRAES